MKFCILKNEFDDSFKNWITACEKNNLEYVLVDSLASKWLNQIQSSGCDVVLTCPPGRETLYKVMYDEKVYILDKVLGLSIYPSYDEISIHENKKYFSYWLDAEKIAHQGTYVFYHKEEALSFAKSAKYPLVTKINIGASGKGVSIHNESDSLISYINKAFEEGLRQSVGPNLKMGNYYQRLKKIITNPSRIKERITVYRKIYNEIQKGYIIVQDYVPHMYEWRIVKIGDSFFGHKKIKSGEKASGTKGINYDSPSDELLSYVKNICESHAFNSMAVDLFEDSNGGYFVNEMQCIFGHVQEYICEKEGNPGRYRFTDGEWYFEEGLFNSNKSYDLRLDSIMSLYSKK